MPFRSGIDAGADMVMVGHLTVPAIDHVPATFSKKLVTDYLRGELGFSGVVITDGLEMAAAGKQPDGEKALRALDAGCDLLLGVYDLPGTVRALEQALQSGELSPGALDAHVLRVLTLKLQYGLVPDSD
jgi:beta-N-acetylhexosaminidase